MLWNRKFRLVVDGEEHGRSRQTDDDYMPWFERVTVRIISPTVYGVGYRLLPYDPLVAGQHRPSGNVDLYDVFASHQSSAGPSAPSYIYDTMMTSVPSSVVNIVEPSDHIDPFDVFASQQSLAGPSTGQHLTPEHDTLQSFVDQGEQNIAAEDDTSVSSEHNLGDKDVELGRGRRRRRPTKCGTSHHLYY
ncbi:serine/threonine-protein phosphatase 7 long form [Dorcoceras hygrometricum]|uniref:Serine/threonine-protein phosphatase 7 long form n=1 Tax=Dorcoceras hygrometricum TaxID=472368 RepID=A0A2Z7B4I8_9LAMI|nr:serine/threonine-protein phosphatase 7 long form [Dorcoceras hygrometricum]